MNANGTTTLRAAATGYGLSFHHIPVTRETKTSAEAAQLELLRKLEIELVVLARYMQVLSADFLTAWGKPVINIHHSFLPAFIGANPYKQAYERGVKIIGATAHFVTADLDEAPIIEQDVVRVDHTHTAEDLVAMGQDVERLVVARAVRYWAEDRVLLVGHKTVVFD